MKHGVITTLFKGDNKRKDNPDNCRAITLLKSTRKKIQVGNDQEKAQSERNSHSKNRSWKKTKLTITYLY